MCTHRLLELQLGVDASGYFHGQPPMGAAVELESIEMMRILLSHGADVSLPWVSAAGRAVLAPLHAAAEQGQLNAVRFLLDHGADLELPREDHDPCSAARRDAKKMSIYEEVCARGSTQ